MNERIEYRGFGTEIRAMMSNEKSYFSLKRWERLFAFLCALSAQTSYIWMNIYSLKPYEILLLVTPLFFIAGYTMKTTEKAKTTLPDAAV